MHKYKTRFCKNLILFHSAAICIFIGIPIMVEKINIIGLFVLLNAFASSAQISPPLGSLDIDFYGDTIQIPHFINSTISISEPISSESIKQFYSHLKKTNIHLFLSNLIAYKKQKKLDDWLFYQLIRTSAEAISPKKKDYHRYTLYKWFLLNNTGFDAVLRLKNDTVLLYIESNEIVYDIPNYTEDGKQYICLNYHDYGFIDFKKSVFETINLNTDSSNHLFSYKINKLPNFKPENYEVKQLNFEYKQSNHGFNIMVNKQIQKIFNNYPTVDYSLQFTVPLSSITYQSLIPALKKTVSTMSQKKGIDYLMHLTRSSFAFENDFILYGKDKRLSPELTLLTEYSDCEDRAAFFFYLVKEIYSLPMIVLSYPAHITVAIKFDDHFESSAKPIIYKGGKYWVCEPTPQSKNLKIGQGLSSLRNEVFEVVYEYQPNF